MEKNLAEFSDLEIKATFYDHMMLRDNANAVIRACHNELQRRAKALQVVEKKPEETPPADVNE